METRTQDRSALARLVVELKSREGSFRTIERRSGITNTTLSLLARGAVEPRAETLGMLVAAYPEIEQAVADAGFTVTMPEVPGLLELARRLQMPPVKVMEQAVREMCENAGIAETSDDNTTRREPCGKRDAHRSPDDRTMFIAHASPCFFLRGIDFPRRCACLLS